MAIAAAAAVPAMAQESPDSVDGDIIVSVPTSVPTATDGDGAPAKKKEAKKGDAGRDSNEYGYANFGGTFTKTDANDKAGGGNVSVGYRAQDGGKVEATVQGEQKDFVSFKLNMTGLGFNFVCDPKNPNDHFCFKLKADLDAEYGVGTKTGTISGAARPTLVYRFVTEDGTEIGVGGGMAAGGLYTARYTDKNGENLGLGGLGPQVELYVNNKWVKGRIHAKNIFGFDPSASAKNYFGGGVDLFVPFMKKDNTQLGWFANYNLTAITHDAPGKVVDNAAPVGGGSGTSWGHDVKTGFQVTF